MMNARLKNILRDPLLHFMVIGGLLFVGTHVFRSTPPVSPIAISADYQAELAEHFAHAYLYSPSQQELESLVTQAVSDEVLYREGLRRGLDRDDPVVRKRLIQKMNFMLEGMATPPMPTTAELTTYYDTYGTRYQSGEKVSFEQMFFDKQRHQGDTIPMALAALAALNAKEMAATQPHGDAFILGNRFTRLTSAQIDRTFGAGFAAQLPTSPTSEWIGPISSPYGLHLIKISEYRPPITPPLAVVHERVYADWQKAEREKRKTALLNDFAAAYPVNIEKFDVVDYAHPQVSLNP